MKRLNAITELRDLPGPVALAIGVFDGVHLGHQEVIRSAMDYTAKHGGTAVVMTFDPHPARLLRPELAPRLLCSTRHKLLLLERMGVTHTLVCQFTTDFAATESTAFVEKLVQSCLPLGYVSVGYSWSFGKGKNGNIHQLMEMGRTHGFGVYGVPEVREAGEVVSSTRIREAVRHGNFDQAKMLLGRDYTVLGKVVTGRQLARQFGFPTANIAMENEELPPNGVYVVEVLLDGAWHRGVANLGLRPTVDGQQKSLEVHLLDRSGDYYGRDMEVRFIHKIRDERKFPDMDALKKQIQLDVAAAR